MMKIFCAGSRYHAAQLPRIEEGFRALGHEITECIDDASLVFSNNLWSDQLITDKRAGRIKGVYIQNVLDLAKHLPDFPLEKAREQLSHADAITTISQYVQSDLRQRLGVESTVIYNPIKPITRLNHKAYPYRAMFVGRVNDSAKRTGVGAAALQILGFTEKEVVTVGDQIPHYGGTYWGVARDEILNLLYNSVDFVILPSGQNEGLLLPMMEAAAAGVIPVICRDLSTREEFFPSSIFPEYLDAEATPQSLARFISRFLQDNDAMSEFKERIHSHYVKNWAEKLSGAGVARKILEVYERIK